jgi:hypothetical protein
MVEPLDPRQYSVKDIFSEIRSRRLVRSSTKEPSVVSRVREGIRKDFVCKFCGAPGRGDVFYRKDLSSNGEIVIEIECRAFKDGEKCGNVETRYLSGL